MSKHHSIDYLEFHANDLTATKTFFETVFGWAFTDYGEEYTAFVGSGKDGGFFKSDKSSKADAGAALTVFYSNNIEATQAAIEKAGGVIIQDIFSFPGGRRFHFTEPSGNEFAVWTDK